MFHNFFVKHSKLNVLPISGKLLEQSHCSRSFTSMSDPGQIKTTTPVWLCYVMQSHLLVLIGKKEKEKEKKMLSTSLNL